MAKAYPDSDSDFSEEEQSPLDKSFSEAASHMRSLASSLNSNQLLELYSLYKQGSEGPCNIARPGWFDGKGRAKWDAWKALEDMPSDKAKHKYIELVKKLDPKWSEAEKGPKETWVAVSSLQRTPEPELNLQELSLLDAAREDCGDRITELLTKNPDLKNQKDEDGLTVLHWAADRDATNALQAAIEAGCDINAVDDSGQTALHYTAACGNVDSTKILVKSGAAMIKDKEGCTPVDLACDDEIRRILEGSH